MTEASNRQPVVLLATKLHRPQITKEIMVRSRLNDLLEPGLSTPMTVVSAPAGYGKSIAVRIWSVQADLPVAWLSLDVDDSEPETFLRYVAAAVRKILPDACGKTWSLVSASSPPPLPVAVRTLINELNDLAEPFILALDDYHRIDASSPVHEIVNRILDHPPQALRLVIVSRRDPPLRLASLRASGLMTEIRLDDLRFTESETLAFLDETVQIQVGKEVLANTQFQLEGWPVGLRLVALYLRTIEDPETFLRTFDGGILHTREYLLEEVILGQPEETRGMLLKAALFDRFCADLCDAVCTKDEASGTRASTGTQFIRTLRHSDLFTIPLDSKGRWFRYHHLFQELLLEHLERHAGPEELNEVHRRASVWFEAQGLIDEAVKHALSAGDDQLAGQAVERHWRSTMNLGNWHIVAGWLSKLPQEAIHARPELILALAFKHLYLFDLGAIPPLLDLVEEATGKDSSAPDLSGEVAMFRGFCAFFSNEGAESLGELEYALERIPPEDVEFRGLAENMFGLAAQFEGQLDRVDRTVMAWIEEPVSRTPLQITNFHWNLAFTHYIAGDLDTSIQHIPRLIEAAESGGISNFIAWGNYFQGLIHLQRGEVGSAVPVLEKAVGLKYLNHARAAADSSGTLAMVYQMNGQPDKAAEALREFSDFSMYLGGPFPVLAHAQAARIAIMDGRPDQALRWLGQTPPLPPLGMMSWFIQPCLIRCRALLAEGSSGNLAEAAQLLEEFLDIARSSHNVCQSVVILGLLSVVYKELGRTKEALPILEEALGLAEPGGFIFPFQELGPPVAELLAQTSEADRGRDFQRRVLRAVTGTAPVTAPASARVPATPEMYEPLTVREQEVLELLAKRLRDKEIAERLFITPQTVNSHTKTLYQKLDVQNRRAAVAKGVEFGLLMKD